MSRLKNLSSILAAIAIFTLSPFFVQANTVSCEKYSQSAVPPSGFAVPYNVFSSADLVVKAQCNDVANTVSIDFGDELGNSYIYNKAYFWRNNAWQEMTIAPDGATDGNWLVGSGKLDIALTSSEIGVNNHILAFICNKDSNSEWKCGCRDSACANHYWQVQRFKLDAPTNVQCSDGTLVNNCAGTAPWYCDAGENLVENCGSCGCAGSWVCGPASTFCCDGTCNSTCSNSSCSQATDPDCSTSGCCGDGTCDSIEDNSLCPADCPLCIDGATQVCGSSIGECSEGTQTCTSGTWGTCSGEVTPAVEICDGLDNDCDGVIDNGCACINGATQVCGSAVGECSEGSQTCVAGAWGACAGDVGPVVETCDGLDNDCDGVLDNGCDCVNGATQTCGSSIGECSEGMQTCMSGIWGSCVGEVSPVVEICGNGLDEDCDGVVDEACLCAEDWTCTSWSTCSSETQTRTCTDSNSCSTTVNKPSENQSCSATCSDDDKDGYGDPASVDCVYSDFDCDDSDCSIKPGVFDFCDNGVDEDCNGSDNNCNSLNAFIAYPSDNTNLKIDNWLSLNGVAMGGSAPYIFRWSSNKDGYLGEGQWFGYVITADASLGEHIITLEVEDADGTKSTETIKVNINSTDTLIANLNFWENEFANGDWLNWGVDIDGGLAPYSVTWSSNLMGAISSDQWVNIDTTLTPWTIGEHIIEAIVQDTNGDMITLSTVLKITNIRLNMWPDNATNFYSGDKIWFSVDTSGGVAPYTYRWTSDRDGLLRDSGSKVDAFDVFQYSSLSEGVHSIELEVLYDGVQTISKKVQIQINPIDPALVDCFDFSDCDDANSCTDDVCSNPGTMTSSCSSNLKTTCQDDDACCPGGCDSSSDNDCTVSADNDDPAKVLVVYNDKCSTDADKNGISDNKELALYYQQKRNIPDANMLPVYPNVGSGGCAYYYYQIASYPDFYNDIVLTIKSKLAEFGENDIYYLNLIGLPTKIYVDTTSNTTRSLDQALITLNDIDEATDYPSYWDYCNSSEYCERFYGATLTKSRFNHSYQYNGDNMYLVTRVHRANLVDSALYGEKYIYNEAGYYRGKGYVDTRYGEYEDTYLNDNYSTFSDASSYAKGDRKMAYGKRVFEIAGWDYEWEVTGKEIGESGAVFTDGGNAEFVNDAMWYEGWYNYNTYHDVWQWKAGSIACDLNSNSGVKFLQSAFKKGLAAGVGVTGEPYLNGHPAPEVFIHYMLNGYNFAESSILSYPGWKWRDIAYGDPLYNPNKVGKTKVKDTTVPKIMQVFNEADISDTSSSTFITARLDANSDNPDVATFKLSYGLNTSYGSILDYDEVYTMEKQFTLGGLSANTVYHYKVTAKDPVGNISVSSDKTFKTSSNETVLPDSIGVSASVNIGNAPLSVDFSSTFGSVPADFTWNFADGSVSSEKNPTHTFDKGFYRVILQADFSNGLSDYKELLIIAK